MRWETPFGPINSERLTDVSWVLFATQSLTLRTIFKNKTGKTREKKQVNNKH